MADHPIQDVLINVERPSRYLGTETNRVLKDPSAVELHLALAFPDLYEIGTSHFGIQILYHLLNQNEVIYAERVFAPARDLEAELRNHDWPLFSLETRTPLNRFHIVGFSLLYELNYTNVLNMLNLGGIPIYAEQRSETDPLIIGGGPCVANPEPIAPFFDALLFGDGEEALPRMTEIWLDWRKATGGRDRQSLLARWARIEGVYIPGFFKAEYAPEGYQLLTPLTSDHLKVTRAVVGDLDQAFFPRQPVMAFGKPVHDRLRLEVSRGCTRGCRFCQAGMIYRPAREREPAHLLEIADQSLAATGYEDLSLLSLSTGDYTCLAPLMEVLMQRCQRDQVAVSLPSIRAGTLTPQLMSLIKKVRKTGFTIAPEAGSQRLRDVINKNLVFEEIEATVEDAFALGWHVIKLYFMIGLPTETQADLDAIVDMVQALKRVKGPVRRRGQINVSVTTFIPKAHTPFQWEPQISLDDSWAKIEYLKTRLRMPGIQLKWQHPHMSLLEGVLARGDRRLSRVIERAWRLGCVFDGWSDQLDFGRWMQAFEDTGVSIDFFTIRNRSLDERLPWDHMDARVSRAFLTEQRHAARQAATVADCRLGKCHQCGVCDFKQIQPHRFDQCPTAAGEPPLPGEASSFEQMALFYTKLSHARYFGHLEVSSLFCRALRRARIPVLYSQGFHPMPRISFDDPIPLGMESHGERMLLKVAAGISCQEVTEGLNRQLPEGIRVVSCRTIKPGTPRRRIDVDQYQIEADPAAIDLQRLQAFKDAEHWPYLRTSRKRPSREVDLKQCVRAIDVTPAGALYLAIERKAPYTLRPADILRGIFNVPEASLAMIRVVKWAPEEYA